MSEWTGKVELVYRVTCGVLQGTEIIPCGPILTVRYPHRKTPDVYVPPLTPDTKQWHCCKKKCATPEFEGGVEHFLDHLLLHQP